MQDGFPQCELWPQRASLAPNPPWTATLIPKYYPAFLTVLTQALASNRKVQRSLQSIKRFPTSISISQFPQSRSTNVRCVYVKLLLLHPGTPILYYCINSPKSTQILRPSHFLCIPISFIALVRWYVCAQTGSIPMYEDQ